jgi:hypothetical protein
LTGYVIGSTFKITDNMNIETIIKKGTNYNISKEYLDSKERGRVEFFYRLVSHQTAFL